MHKLYLGIATVAIMALVSCKSGEQSKNEETMGSISQKTIESAEQQLMEKFGETERIRIKKGISQVAMFWQEEDGSEDDFIKFCLENFATGDNLYVLFQKLERNYEILYGHFNKMNVALLFPIHVDDGDTITPVDMMFGSYSPAAHIEEDFFANKIAFVSLLNFPHYTLEEKNSYGMDWDELQWAYVRMGDMYDSRVPAELSLEQSKVMTEADAYISEYNIYMGFLRDDKNIQYFNDTLKLISHWGLRDELKSQYAHADGLDKQKIIYQVMKQIINQEIPSQVINNNEYLWNPYTNSLTKDGKKVDVIREDDIRYDHLRKNFIAVKNQDPYYPYYPTYIERKFEGEMQMPQEQVEKLFIDFVSAPEIREIGKLISSRLGRPLEPFDIWYDGFKSRSETSESDLDKLVMSKYPGA